MTSMEVIDNTIIDLKVGLNFAGLVGNDFLKEYVENRIMDIDKNKETYNYVSDITLVNSYVVDLVLFINVSNIVNDIDNKSYFKERLMSIVKLYPELRNRRDVVNLI